MGKVYVMENTNVNATYRLFIIIFFFAVSIFFFNSQKEKIILATHLDGLDTSPSSFSFSSDQAYHHISSLLVSRNIDLIVKFINQSMNYCAINLVEKIIVDKSFLLSDIEKMKILF